jgi:transposase
MAKTFREWSPEQAWLFPPSVLDLVPEEHPAHFLRDLVRESLDLSEILGAYGEGRGQPPYHPTMMTALLLYAYSRGVYSSRRIARACEERVDFMAVTGMQKPDHDTINEFRRRHLPALKGLFGQVLRVCREAGLARLGHVALDGTKMPANASKHKAMSYKRMREAETDLVKEVEGWLDTAEAVDRNEDARYGKGKRGDEMPAWMRSRKQRLEKIREAKAALEAQAQEQARLKAQEPRRKKRPPGAPGPQHRPPNQQPPDTAQRNFTDPDSRIMRTRRTFEQAYNCQAAVDADHQVIVACEVINQQNDGDQLVPMVDQIRKNCGRHARELSADANYCSEENLRELSRRRIRAYVATGGQRHGSASPTSSAWQKRGPRAEAMRMRLRRGGHRSRYRLRKQVVEPVFGQMKHARGFRQFLMRGLEKVRGEWSLLCTAHNLNKLIQALAAAQ